VEGVAKKKAIKARNPLEPLQTFSWFVLCLLGLGLVAGVVGLVTGQGVILGWGHASICVTTAGTGASAAMPWDLHPHAGVSLGAADIELCARTPSAGQRWWYSLEELPGTATAIVVALTTYLTLRLAQRHGVYTPGVAARLRFLGWFLMADSVLRPTIELYASHKLWASMTDGPMPTLWNPVWPLLFAGIALLSLARIMGVGSAMREDLEGVV
jgi:hypothetical protein